MTVRRRSGGRRPRTRWTVGAALTLLVLAGSGCGGGDDDAGGDKVSHQTPEGAVRGYVEVLRDNDLPGIVEWVRPEDRDDVRRQLNRAAPDTRITVDEFEVTGSERRDEDTVRVGVRLFAKACSEGLTQCIDLGARDFAITDRVDGLWYLRDGEGILDD